MTFLFEAKMLLERSVAFSPDVLHVLAGVIVAVIAAVLLRSPLSSWRPWLVTLVAALANEALDLTVERWPSIGMQAGEGARDLILTMILPTLLLIGLRMKPEIFAPPSDARCAKPGDPWSRDC